MNAIDLTNWVDVDGYWSSIDSGIIFTNVDATADASTGSCHTGNHDNVWFKYLPDNSDFSIDFHLKTGGSEGGIRYLALTAWVDTAGSGSLIELACTSIVVSQPTRFDDLLLEDLFLLPGTAYYFSVQSAVSGIEGSFSLEVELTYWDDLPVTDYSIGRDLHDYEPKDYTIWIFTSDSTSRHAENPPPIDCYYPPECNGIENPYFGGPSCLPPSYHDPFGNSINRFATYGTDPRQKYYVYLPDVVDSTTEVVVLVHGGGWVTGPRPDSIQGYIFSVAHTSESDSSLVRTLVDNGFVVVSLLYRLVKTFEPGDSSTSTITMADQIDDIDSAVNHIILNFPECLSVNTDNIHLLGESAGGQLALLYAYVQADTNRVKSVISMYAPTNVPNYGQFLQKGYFNYPSFTCSNTFEDLMFPVWWPWAMNNSKITISTNTNNCPPDSNQFVILDSLYHVQNGIWRIFKAYNFIQAAADIVDTTPLDNSVLNLLSPKTAISTGNPIPTFIMHGLNDILVPYNLPIIIGPSPVNGMYTALNDNGGVTADICATGSTGTCSPIDLSAITTEHRIRTYEGANHGWGGSNIAMYEILRQDVLIWLLNH